MATYNKFHQFSKDLVDGKHNFSSHVFKVMLTNAAPVATNTVKSDITELAAGNGYTAGGPATTISVSTSGGVTKVVGSNVSVTASGAVGPFRYAVLYNDTQSSPAKPLVAWWDYGSPVNMVATEVFTVAFDATDGIFNVQ